MNGDDGQHLSAPFWTRSSWRRHTGQATVALFFAAGCSFLASIAVARALTSSSYGALLLAVTAVGSIASFLDVSFEEAVVHYGSKAEAAGDTGGVRALLRASLRLDLAVGGGVFALILIAAPWLAELISGGGLNPALVRLAAIEVLLLTINGTTGTTLVLARRPHLRAWSMAATGAMRLAFVATALSVSREPTTVLLAYLAASGIGAGLQASLAIAVAHRTWPTSATIRLPVGTRRLLSFGFQSSVTTTILAVQTGLVSVILARTSGTSEVAVYNVALFPVTLAALSTAPLRMTTMTEQASLWARGRGDQLWRSILAYSKVALAVGVAGAAVGWVVLQPGLTALYSTKYRASVEPARTLLIPAVVLLVTGWAKMLPAAVGRPAVRTVATAIELGATALLVAWLADDGAVGAAVAMAIVSTSLAIAWFIIARRMLAADPDRGAAKGGSRGR